MLRAMRGHPIPQRRAWVLIGVDPKTVRRRRGRKRAQIGRTPMPAPMRPNQWWSLDFLSDTLGACRKFRTLAVNDDCCRENLALIADTSISGARVARELDALVRIYGKPACIVSDNGTVFTTPGTLVMNAGRPGAGHYNQTSYFDEAVDIHHIFPRAWSQKNGITRERYDTIINKTPLSSKSVRIVGGDAPSVYLTRLPKQGPASDAAIVTHLESHVIDPLLLRSDDFDGFVGRRQEALLGLIEAATGKAIYRGSATCSGRHGLPCVVARRPSGLSLRGRDRPLPHKAGPHRPAGREDRADHRHQMEAHDPADR